VQVICPVVEFGVVPTPILVACKLALIVVALLKLVVPLTDRVLLSVVAPLTPKVELSVVAPVTPSVELSVVPPVTLNVPLTLLPIVPLQLVDFVQLPSAAL